MNNCTKDVENNIHLKATLQWLCRAQDAAGCGGVSGGYVPGKGWKPPYPETTGYIIPTFLNYSTFSGDDSYKTRAMAMGNWEIEIQLPSGGVRGGIGLKAEPMIFDTGQVILGWISLYRETNDRKYLEATTRAANWLVKIQDSDGKWSKHEFLGHPHAYNTRVAWALAQAHELTGDMKYQEAAGNNMQWVLSLAEENGWLKHMAFSPNEKPFTHTIAYTLRGLLETSRYLQGDVAARAILAVEKASSKIIETHRLDRTDGNATFLPGQLNPNWKSWSRYACVTGNAQFAILFLKLHEMLHHDKFLKSAMNLLDAVGRTQDLGSDDPGIRGAIPGSHPFNGRYQRKTYPNWAAKFFADALMLKARNP
ncbi:MAG: hypothetical protein R6W91_00575 [Thermoplasmata archaeon]